MKIGVKQKVNGFSLLELMIGLAVLLVLASLAISSNHTKLDKVALMQAQLDLLNFSAKMEEFKLVNGTYIGAAGTKAKQQAVGIPWVYQNYSPSTEAFEQAKYRLSIESADKVSFVLLAKPLTDNLQGLRYHSGGQKYWDQNSDGVFASDEMCWKC